MKKKTIVFSAAAVLVLVGTSAVLIPKWMENEMERRLNLIEVVIASHDLLPRTRISEEDIITIQVPSAYLNDAAYILKEDVLGMITVKNGFIPQGSLFYRSALEDSSLVNDAAVLDLHQNQVLYALETNIIALGANALSSGQFVDVYVTIKQSQQDSKIGSILKNVRILGIKDHKGLNLDDPQSTQMPHVIQLAISEQALPILQMAEQMGEISYYASSSAYKADIECEIEWESEMLDFLGFKKETVDE